MLHEQEYSKLTMRHILVKDVNFQYTYIDKVNDAFEA